MCSGGRELREEQFGHRSNMPTPRRAARSVGSGSTGRRHATRSQGIVGHREGGTSGDSGWHAFASERNERQRAERRGVGMCSGGRELREEQFGHRSNMPTPRRAARSVGSGSTGRRHATQCHGSAGIVRAPPPATRGGMPSARSVSGEAQACALAGASCGENSSRVAATCLRPGGPGSVCAGGTTGRRHATRSHGIVGRQKHATRRLDQSGAARRGEGMPPSVTDHRTPAARYLFRLTSDSGWHAFGSERQRRGVGMCSGGCELRGKTVRASLQTCLRPGGLGSISRERHDGAKACHPSSQIIGRQKHATRRPTTHHVH